MNVKPYIYSIYGLHYPHINSILYKPYKKERGQRNGKRKHPQPQYLSLGTRVLCHAFRKLSLPSGEYVVMPVK